MLRATLENAALILMSTVVWATAALAQEPPGCGVKELPPFDTGGARICFQWQGTWRTTDVTVPGENTEYAGTVFAPTTDPGPEDDLYPGVAVLHGGGGGVKESMFWIARYLAGHGYVVVAIDTTGNESAYAEAMVAMVDFLAAPDQPYALITDPERIGVSGHSQGAKAANYVQWVDSRVDAVVAFDNLGADLGGDEGTPGQCPQYTTGLRPLAPSRPLEPRVPAMGQASDYPCYYSPENLDPEQKKSGYRAWRGAGIPSMLLVFLGADHLDWSQFAPKDNVRQFTDDPEMRYRIFSYFAGAWFDRWLKEDETATDRLFAPNVAGVPFGDLLSTTYTSAAFVDGIDCEDLASCPDL